jgi:phage shock protein PspC (stress-responsive transcriptional regulator)
MNRVITINLNGVAYQLEESGYEQLRAYLDHAARRLEGNPDKDEILADIEQAIADKFRALLGAYKTVVVTREVADVITQMGPVQDASGAAGAQPASGAQASGGAGPTSPGARRLYKINDGAMLAGVCNGLSAYLNLDVSIIRVGFALLTIFWGTGLLVYVILAFILPAANTPAEKAAATGAAATAEEFIRRAKAGYYEGMKHFNDPQTRREWKRKFKQDMRDWKYGFRRQMQDNAAQWQQHWTQGGPPHPGAWVGMGFTLMLLHWVKLLCFVAACYAIYSLLAHGAVFGLALPADIPVWVGVVAVCIIYQFLTWPIKVLRYSWYCHGGPRWGCGAGMSGPLDGLVWLGFLLALVWLADHHSPAFHAWLQDLPPLIHHTADRVQEWWARR